MLHAGQPEWLADGVLELYTSMDTVVTDAIEQVTGTPARTFAQFAADHAEAFAQGGAGHD